MYSLSSEESVIFIEILSSFVKSLIQNFDELYVVIMNVFY